MLTLPPRRAELPSPSRGGCKNGNDTNNNENKNDKSSAFPLLRFVLVVSLSFFYLFPKATAGAVGSTSAQHRRSYSGGSVAGEQLVL